MNHSPPGCPEKYDAFCLQTRIVTACLLLKDAGCEELLGKLLADNSALQVLAEHPCDLLHLPETAHV